jgi:hypothetical protein
METAAAAKPLWEKSPYQPMARILFPRLVRQAQAGEPIFYSDLARELGMKNPTGRNLNWPLGSVGESLKAIARRSTKFGPSIPPIQCLVINKAYKVPGFGIEGFLDGNYRALSKWEREHQIRNLQRAVFDFARWHEVLAECGLEPLSLSSDRGQTSVPPRGGGEESEDHRRLKRFVAANPQLVRLAAGLRGQEECELLSGDFVDVVFESRDEWVAVEVKSKRSPEGDIKRGIFQCVKYRAVGRATQALEDIPKRVRAVLILEGKFPASLHRMRNLLAVDVRGGVTPA